MKNITLDTAKPAQTIAITTAKKISITIYV